MSVDVVFWSSAAVLLYGWLGYPVMAIVLAMVLPRRRSLSTSRRMTVAVVVVAHNEEREIGARIQDLLDQDLEPDDEVVLASDGSTDRTCEIAREVGGPRLRVLDLTEHLGRAYAHNRFAESSAADILVYTDAATRFRPGFIAAIRRAFQDPAVGAVVGRLIFESSRNTHISLGERIYWEYEIRLRLAESRLGVLGNGTGAAMAIRRDLYRPIRLNEDVDTASPIDVVLQGHRVVYAVDAVAIDEPPETEHGEVRAKRRGVAQTVICIINRLSLGAVTSHPAFFVALASHRLVRYLTFPLAAACAASAAVLLAGPAGSATLPATVVWGGIGMAFAGWLVRRRWPMAGLPAAFVVATWGMLLGVIAAFRGEAPATYRSTQ